MPEATADPRNEHDPALAQTGPGKHDDPVSSCTVSIRPGDRHVGNEDGIVVVAIC